MGLTLTTLNIPGEASAILPLLKNGETLRTHCPGWTIILPGETDDHGYASLEKLAKKCPGPCLFFHYFDDDMFTLRLYVDGKRKAVLSSDPETEKSTQVALISLAVFGDDSITPALKLVNKSDDIEEQLALAEEALGLSLLEDPEFEPRNVERSTKTFDEVTARLKALKKRRNTYRSVLLEAAEVPDALRKVSPAAAYGIPRVRHAALPAQDSMGRPLEGQVQVDVRQDALFHPSGDYIGCAFLNHRPAAAVRMNTRDELLWAFAPEGVNSLLVCPAKDADTLLVFDPTASQAHLWLLHAADGRVLHECHLPESCPGMPRWIAAIGQYAAFWYAKDGSGFTLLDEQLRIIGRREYPGRPLPFARPVTVEGSVFWGQDVFSHRVMSYDAAEGTLTEIPLEVRAYFTGLGANGLLTGLQTGKELLLFDRTGRLVSKHPFKGVATMMNIPVIDGRMYIVEEMGSLSLAIRETPLEKRFWRLEKI